MNCFSTPLAFLCIQDTGDSDSEAEQERLAEYEAALKENAPDFVLDPDAAEADVSQDSPEWYQIHLATERIRIPEILFQVGIRLSWEQIFPNCGGM